MGDSHEPGNEDDEKLLSRTHLATLIVADFLITLVWFIIAASAYNVTEHATFLGLEGWQIRVTVTLLGLVPTATLLLIGWDDVDALWMVVRTRRLKRRQQYRVLARGEHGASTRHGRALPSPDRDEERDTSA